MAAITNDNRLAKWNAAAITVAAVAIASLSPSAAAPADQQVAAEGGTQSGCAKAQMHAIPDTVSAGTVGGEALQPSLVIVRPKEGEVFTDKPIVVEVRVENFKLESPRPYFGSPNPNDVGHLHFFLDDYPEVATSATELMFGKMAGDKYLSRGDHTIAVELVHDNHDTLEPRVWKRVHFKTTH